METNRTQSLSPIICRQTIPYLALASFAGICFVMSTVCNVLCWLQITPLGGHAIFLLHLGVFIVWFPLVMLANRTMPKAGRNNVQHLLNELPRQIRIAAGCLFVYAIANFIIFAVSSNQYPKGKVPFYLEVRGFSGHWMLFYGFALIGFTALTRWTLRELRKNPHITPLDPFLR